MSEELFVQELFADELNKRKKNGHGASASTFFDIPPPANRLTAECKKEKGNNIE